MASSGPQLRFRRSGRHTSQCKLVNAGRPLGPLTGPRHDTLCVSMAGWWITPFELDAR
jgi:hypothetical protein